MAVCKKRFLLHSSIVFPLPYSVHPPFSVKLTISGYWKTFRVSLEKAREFSIWWMTILLTIEGLSPLVLSRLIFT